MCIIFEIRGNPFFLIRENLIFIFCQVLVFVLYIFEAIDLKRQNIITYLLVFAYSAFWKKRNNNFLPRANGSRPNSFVINLLYCQFSEHVMAALK